MIFPSLHLAVLALLASRIQITQASNSTISPSSLVVLSSTIQYNITANSSSLYETQTASTRTNVIPSVSPSSVANGSKSSAFTRYSNSMTATEVTASVTEPTISIMQSNYTTTSSTPTTVLTVKGLPDGKVIAVLAGILGAALLILLGIIVSKSMEQTQGLGLKDCHLTRSKVIVWSITLRE